MAAWMDVIAGWDGWWSFNECMEWDGWAKAQRGIRHTGYDM